VNPAQQWPTDDAFRKFAARLADAVLAHFARGGVLTDYLHRHQSPNGIESCCPLGCLPGAQTTHPQYILVRPERTGSRRRGQLFIRGFDGKSPFPLEVEPYCRLGREYRERFTHDGAAPHLYEGL